MVLVEELLPGPLEWFHGVYFDWEDHLRSYFPAAYYHLLDEDPVMVTPEGMSRIYLQSD